MSMATTAAAACFSSQWHKLSAHQIPVKIKIRKRKNHQFLHFCTAQAGDQSSSTLNASDGFLGKSPQEVRVMVTGSTGYIGKFVVRELVSRQFNVLAIARPPQTQSAAPDPFPGAKLCLADVTDKASLLHSLQQHLQGTPDPNGPDYVSPNPNPNLDPKPKVDVLICCLASRSGGVSDSWKVDYAASRNSVDAAVELGAKHIVLLSAICVQKPLLEFQRAKLRLEAELRTDLPEDVSWSVVRPTAFFKSLGGQVEIVKSGGPYVVFGDGKLCSCKPISERDLAAFIVDCVCDQTLHRRILPVGGPGDAYTPLQQGELLFKLAGKSPRFIKVPIQVMDGAIAFLDFLVRFFPGLEDAAEYAKIGRYYAAESMLVLNESGEYDAGATPSYGNDTLEEFFQRVLREGLAGQELGEQAFFQKS